MGVWCWRMLLLKNSFILLYLFMSIISGSSGQPQRGLSQYKWRKRVIMTFSQSEEHPELQRLRTEVSRATCEYNNRNLVHEHRNSQDEFKILLIGYDGLVKYTADEVNLQTIFDIIDQMPMRRREMRFDNDC